MNPVGRKLDKTSQDLVDEFLKNGGKITQCEKNARTEDIEYKGGFYAKRRKKKEAESKDD
jgi:hypothetical protein